MDVFFWAQEWFYFIIKLHIKYSIIYLAGSSFPFLHDPLSVCTCVKVAIGAGRFWASSVPIKAGFKSVFFPPLIIFFFLRMVTFSGST